MFDKGAIWIAGTMSGTSLDGVDAALLCTDGDVISEFGACRYRAYDETEQSHLRAALGAWPHSVTEPASGSTHVAQAAQVVERAHQEVLSELLSEAQLIGFHGQTLAHDPQNGRTHQAGDGAALAHATGVPVVWDFRSADVQAGGEGAPLAPFFHHACARWIGADEPLAFVNLGGVGNLTWVDPRVSSPHTPGALLAFDTGPANAPINDLMRARRQLAFDRDGALAAEGKAEQRVIDEACDRSYFSRPAPKSLDRDSFADLMEGVQHLDDHDAVATLTAIAGKSVALGLRLCPSPPSRLLVTGGGRKNATMMAVLEDYASCPVAPVEDAGLDGDMLEAQAFAYLAARSVRGLPLSAPSTTAVPVPMSGGRLSHP